MVNMKLFFNDENNPFYIVKRKDVVGPAHHYSWIDIVWQRFVLLCMAFLIFSFFYHLVTGHPVI